MSYEYNIPHIDFADEDFNGNDGADAYFDILQQMQEKLNLKSDSLVEERYECITAVNVTQIEEGPDTSSKNCESENMMSNKSSSVDSPEDHKVASESYESENFQAPLFDVKHDLSEVSNSHSQLCKSEDKLYESQDSNSTLSNAESQVNNCKDQKFGILSGPSTEEKENKRGDCVLKEITDNIQNIRENKKRKSDVDHGCAKKFISLAQGIQDFHSQVLRAKGNKISGVSRWHVTIPQSPLLLAKTRSRPVNYPSAEERIEKEIEEMKSFKLKAHKVNKKLFEPLQPGKRVQRTIAVEPFNLTEFKRKESSCPSNSPFYFKANPVPKGILEHPIGVPEKKTLPLTVAHTPTFVAKHKLKFQTIEEVDGSLVVTNKSPAHPNVCYTKSLSTTSPVPFSFEERDKIMLKNKEEKIKKVLQEEKEARHFHANPVPGFVKKISKMCKDSRSSSRSSQISEDEERTMFRAQPALVLQKAPFKPKLPEHACTSPTNVVLHTQQRALSRKEFDEHLKLRAEAIDAELQRRKELEKAREQEEIARLRQQAVHKAQPIRTYKPIPDKPRLPITSPNTPKFSDRFKK